MFTSSQINELAQRLKDVAKINRLILFGSYANGTANAYSDLDLVVVLDEPGFLKSYMERVRRRAQLSRSLSGISRSHSIDLLVYTRDEWEKLRTINSSFIREILSTGQTLP